MYVCFDPTNCNAWHKSFLPLQPDFADLVLQLVASAGGAGLEAGAVVVDGVGGEVEEGGDAGGVVDAEADEGGHAHVGGELAVGA